MKKQLFLTVPLAALLAMPAVAQQAPADNSQPPANVQVQTQSSTDQQASAQDQNSSQSGRQPLTYESRQGFWGKLNPFARKKYVQRQLEPVQGRVNELDQLTSENARMIKDVDARASEGIRLASNRVNEADQHAMEASNRAQQANQTATLATQHLQTVQTAVNNIDQYKPVSDVEIRFRPGQLALSKRSKDALDQMAEPLKTQKGYIIEVQGFSSGRGQAAVENSQRMAESIVRYLVLNHDVPVYRIYTLGMGNAPVQATTGNGRARRTTGGRVDVAVLTNGVDQLESMAGPGPATASSASSPVGATQQMPNAGADQQQPSSAAPASNQNAPAVSPR